MFLLQEGLNAIRWLGETQPFASVPFLTVIRFAYAPNPVTGVGVVSFQPGDVLSALQMLVKGYDYLIDATGPYLIPTDAGPAQAGSFSDFPGYVPAVPSTAPMTPVGRTETGFAAEPILGGRLVAQTTIGLRHYDTSNPTHHHLLFGVALNAALPGGAVSVRRPGFVRFDGWGLPPDSLLLAGSDGRLVSSIPATSFYHIMGRSLDGDTFIYQPEIVIILSNPQTLLQNGT